MKRLSALLLALLLLFPSCARSDRWEANAAEGSPVYTQEYPKTEHTVCTGFSFTMTDADRLRAHLDTVTLKFAADADNRYDIALRIEDASCRLLGETGRLRPGTYLEGLRLAFIPSSESEITLTVTAYAGNGNPVRKTTLYGRLDVSENG